jgi:hypothetical protein
MVGGLAACAADPGEDPTDLEATDDDLSAAARALTGRYTALEASQDLASLKLNTTGTFTADTYFKVAQPGSKMACVSGPCTLPERGRFTARRLRNGDYSLSLNPEGAAPARTYRVALATDGGPALFSKSTANGRQSWQMKRQATCSALRCGVGTSCVNTADGAVCEPTLPAACASMSCMAGTRCISKPGSSTEAICAPSCLVMRCSAGHECVDPPNQPSRCEPVLPPACAMTTCPVDYLCVAGPGPQGVDCVPGCALMDCLPGLRCVESVTGAHCVR